MKREIKFRGLRTDGKGWVIGSLAYLFDDKLKPYIMPSCNSAQAAFMDGAGLALGGFVPVIPETVGQFITKIYGENPVYDGDILQIPCDIGGAKPRYSIANDGVDWILLHYGRHDSMNGYRWGSLSRILDTDIIRDFGKLIVVGNIHEQ